MKRLLFLGLTALFSVCQSFAYTFMVGEYGYDVDVDDEGQYAIWCGHAGRYDTLYVPAEITYAGRSLPVKKLVLDEVSYHISNVYIPASIIMITDATQNTNALSSIHVDEANPVYASVDDKYLIEKATGKLIKACYNVGIPEGITEIGPYAFYKTRITSLCVPATIKSIGVGAFGRSQLIDVKFEEGTTLTSLPERVFSGNEHLTNIDIPESVTEIGNSAFDGCISLDITIPNGITKIGDNAFSECVKLSSIELRSVKEIGYSAFYECRSLKRVMLHNVQTIDGYAFARCYTLYTVCLPKTLESIGNRAFYLCSSINRILMEGNVPPSMNGEDIFPSVTQQLAATLYVPIGSKAAYKAANVWDDFMYIEEVDGFDAITNVKDETAKTTSYDLQGRKLTGVPSKGIYIKDGKKVVK